MAKSEQISKVDDLYAQGKYQQAATECARMLDGLKDGSGEQALTLLKLGKLHDKLHNLEKAIDCLRQSLEISRKVFGENNEKTAEAMSALALALAAHGETNEAESLVEEATKIRCKACGVDSPEAADAYDDMGLVHLSCGHPQEAEKSLVRSMGIRRRSPGKMHKDYAISLRHTAILRQKEGKVSLSEPLLNQSVDILQRQLGKDHPEVGASLDLLAEQQFDRKRPIEAEKNWLRVRDILAPALPEEHPQRISVLNRLAACALILRSSEEAAQLYNQALEICDRAYEEDTIFKLDAVLGLGLTYLRDYQFALAEPHVKRGLRMIEGLSAKEMRLENLLIDKLLTIYIFQGKFGDALLLLPNSLRAKHTADFHDTMDTIYQLANVIRKAIGKEPLKH
jgi:tetratricopeptide (TPR) repeat protein